MTKNLIALIALHAEITERQASRRKVIAEIIADKDGIISSASGPDDSKALEKLNVLASQEAMAQRQLKIDEREMAGLAARLLNEADTVKGKTVKALVAKRDAVMARLDSKFAAEYPDANDRRKAIASLKPVPRELYLVRRRIDSFSGYRFDPQHTDEFKYARQILGMVAQSVAECLS